VVLCGCVCCVAVFGMCQYVGVFGDVVVLCGHVGCGVWWWRQWCVIAVVCSGSGVWWRWWCVVSVVICGAVWWWLCVAEVFLVVVCGGTGGVWQWRCVSVVVCGLSGGGHGGSVGSAAATADSVASYHFHTCVLAFAYESTTISI
jgi:hypothetical protein